MRPWFKIPTSDRMELLKLYKSQGFSYKDAVNDFETSLPKYEGGGEIQEFSPIQRKDFEGNFIGRYKSKKDIPHGDFARYYLGAPLKGDRELHYSEYAPSNSYNKDAKYIAYKNKEFENALIDYINDNYTGKTLRPSYSKNPKNLKDWKTYKSFDDLGNFKLDIGRDSSGYYLSYYDIWNYGRKDSPDLSKTEFLGTAKPFEIYDRIYLEKDDDNKYRRKILNTSIELPKTIPNYIVPNTF